MHDVVQRTTREWGETGAEYHGGIQMFAFFHDAVIHTGNTLIEVAVNQAFLDIVPENFIAEGDYVALQGRGEARTKSGVDYNNTYCWVYRFRDGKIISIVEYLDTELVRKAFG